MAYFNGEALREGSLCQVRERHRLPNSMHAPRACLAVLRSVAVEFGRVVSVRDQVHDVHWGKWGRGVQLEALEDLVVGEVPEDMQHARLQE